MLRTHHVRRMIRQLRGTIAISTVSQVVRQPQNVRATICLQRTIRRATCAPARQAISLGEEHRLCAAIGDRPVAALLANAGHGLGRAFLDQDFSDINHVIDTNTGTIYLTHRVGRHMRASGQGRILFTGSIAGFMPGTFQAVYNGTQAFIDSFALALRNELQDTGVTVTCLMPGVTDTNFFARADMLDTKVGTQENKADPADVAKIGNGRCHTRRSARAAASQNGGARQRSKVGGFVSRATDPSSASTAQLLDFDQNRSRGESASRARSACSAMNSAWRVSMREPAPTQSGGKTSWYSRT